MKTVITIAIALGLALNAQAGGHRRIISSPNYCYGVQGWDDLTDQLAQWQEYQYELQVQRQLEAIQDQLEQLQEDEQ